MMEGNQLRAVQESYLLGHAYNPRHPDTWDLAWDDLGKLEINSPETELILRSRTHFQVTDLAAATLHHHGKLPTYDGKWGPAVASVVNAQRDCWVPDYAAPKDVEIRYPDHPEIEEIAKRMRDDVPSPIGVGNWAGCHNIGDFHAATVRVDVSGMGQHLQPSFRKVLTRVRDSYAQLGLWFQFVNRGRDMISGEEFSGTHFNIDFTFVSRSNGWIGLAIIGQNQACSSNIWCRYLASYRGGDVVTEWTTLIKHELGHNCGRGHTRGGVMNPSIVRGLPWQWDQSDPSFNWLAAQFGGIPVGVDNPPPPPSDPILQRIEGLERRQLQDDVRNAVQDEVIAHLLRGEND